MEDVWKCQSAWSKGENLGACFCKYFIAFSLLEITFWFLNDILMHNPKYNKNNFHKKPFKKNLAHLPTQQKKPWNTWIHNTLTNKSFIGKTNLHNFQHSNKNTKKRNLKYMNSRHNNKQIIYWQNYRLTNLFSSALRGY